jgi:outer membrane biosynthesis protein TonB
MARADTKSSLSPAMLASGALHALALAAALIAWPHRSRPIELGSAVPVNIVAQGPVANIRPAEQGPEDVEAMTEEPVPEAPPQPAAPAPTPAPTPPAPLPKPAPPPKPAPAPTPTPAPAPKAAPTPPKPAAKPAPSFDLDALAATVAKRAAAQGGPRSSARQGPARQETAVQARQAVGASNAMIGSALGVLAAELQRRWNPNCEVEGGSDVNIRVGFRLIQGGRIVGDVESSGAMSNDPVIKAASDRAVRAVRQAAPFESLPPELFGQKIVVNFNAKQACAN